MMNVNLVITSSKVISASYAVYDTFATVIILCNFTASGTAFDFNKVQDHLYIVGM